MLGVRIGYSRTIDSKVAKRGTCGALDFEIGALEEEEYGLEGIAVDLSNI